jgi:hypothetical protein
MLVPDSVHPENTIYYNSAFVLKLLQEQREMEFLDLFVHTNGEKSMTMPVFQLCLDWLFLIDLVAINNEGRIELCTSSH